MDPFTVSISALLLVAFGLLVASFRVFFSNERSLIHLRARLIAKHSETQKRRLDLIEIRNRARLLEDTVKNGTSAVEKMHKTIASTTFSLIDHFAKDEEFRENARRARDSHDQTTRQLYEAARTTNKALHIVADSLFIGRREKKLITRSKPKDQK